MPKRKNPHENPGRIPAKKIPDNRANQGREKRTLHKKPPENPLTESMRKAKVKTKATVKASPRVKDEDPNEQQCAGS
jgi:hypothetical protein